MTTIKLEESKSTAAHIALFSSILSQVQDSGLCACDKLKDILKILQDSWKTLVASLSNKPNLTFDGVRASILMKRSRGELVENVVDQLT